jgi:hypothetical protein
MILICIESRGSREKGKVTALKFLAQRQTEGQTRNKNRTGDNGGRCHLFVKAPRPKGANVVDAYSLPGRRGFLGRVRSRAGCTSPGCTVGVGCGGLAPGGQIQISMKSASR